MVEYLHPEERYATSYVERRYYIPSARTTSALYAFNPPAFYCIVSCSLQSTRYGSIRALLIDGNDAYVIKEEIEYTVYAAVVYTVLGSSTSFE